MTKLQSYIDRFGAVAGPRLYHAIQSRSALIGANFRRRQAIAGLTGRPVAVRRSTPRMAAMPLLPERPGDESGSVA